MFARMVIGEAINDDQLREFRTIFKEEIESAILKEPGIKTAGLLTEDGGNMAVVLTGWDTREHCLQYHYSRAYRQFVAKTQHLLVGDFVVKLFRTE